MSNTVLIAIVAFGTGCLVGGWFIGWRAEVRLQAELKKARSRADKRVQEAEKQTAEWIVIQLRTWVQAMEKLPELFGLVYDQDPAKEASYGEIRFDYDGQNGEWVLKGFTRGIQYRVFLRRGKMAIEWHNGKGWDTADIDTAEDLTVPEVDAITAVLTAKRAADRAPSTAS